MKLYRYEDVNYGGRTRIMEREFDVIKETNCGYWIEYYNKDGKKWISSQARKRYAYPERENAMVNFKARKHRQIQIVGAQLQQAKDALQNADIDFPEFDNIKPKRRSDMSSLWEDWGFHD